MSVSCRLIRDQRGATMVQYIVVVGIVGLGGVAALKTYNSTVGGASDAQGATVECVALGSGDCPHGGGGAFPPPPPAGTSPPIGTNDPLAQNDPPPGTQCTGGSCGLPGSRCFAAGTLVSTPTGFTPIEEIHAGDEVLSFREETGQVTVGRVSATFVTPNRDLLEVHLRGDAAPLRTTPGHRFFTLDRGWLGSEGLVEGEPLVDPAGVPVFVDYVAQNSEKDTVYNFEVEETHTYFVGSERVLVHNPIVSLPHGGKTFNNFVPPNEGVAPVGIVKLTDVDPTVNDAVTALQGQYKNSKVIPWSSFNPGSPTHDPKALKGIGDVIVVGHGSESSAHGAGWVVIGDKGTTSHGVITGADVGQGLDLAGYDPLRVKGVKDPEILAASCSSAKDCTNMPSVAEGIADKAGHTTHGFTEPIKIVDEPGSGKAIVLTDGVPQTFDPKVPAQPPKDMCVIQ